MIFRMTPEQVEAHNRRVQEARSVSLLGADDEANHARSEAMKKLRPPKPEKPKEPRQKWDYEQRLAQQLDDAGISGFYVDAEYIEGRGLRGDAVFPLDRLIVEIQGEVHRVKKQFRADILKAQDTMKAGYRLLPIATGQVRDGSAVVVIREVLDVIRGR